MGEGVGRGMGWHGLKHSKSCGERTEENEWRSVAVWEGAL